MDPREQGRGRENPTPSYGSLLIDFERYVQAHPHDAERLLATLTAIAFQNGCLSPDLFPPPPVDELGRVGLPPANVPLAPYKAEYKGCKVRIADDGVPTVIPETKQKPEPPEPIRIDIRALFDKLYPKSDPPSD